MFAWSGTTMSDQNFQVENEKEVDLDPEAEIVQRQLDQEISSRLEEVPTVDVNDSIQPTMNSIISNFQSLLHSLMSMGQSSADEDMSGGMNIPISGEEIDELATFQSLDLNLQKEFPAWEALLQDENHEEWERRCRQTIPLRVLYSPLIKQLETFRGKLLAYLGAWNPCPEHCSRNIYILEDQLTAHRIPSLNQTDAVRGKLGFSRGVHAWDVRIVGPLGSHLSIGVATPQAELWTKEGYVSLVGDDPYSWGWDIVFGNVSHAGKVISSYPHKFAYEYTPGDCIRMILDCEKRTVSYVVNEVEFGVAFHHLPNITFYPSVAMVYGNIEVSLIYRGKPPALTG